MTFYLRPPNGTTQLHSIEKLAITRLKFLIRLHGTSGDQVKVHDLLTEISLVEDSDCLIEGTRKDRISHYILRLAFSRSPKFRQFLLKVEKLLFAVRFLNMDSKSLIKLLYSLDSTLLKRKDTGFSNTPETVDVLRTFAQLRYKFGSWQRLVELYLTGDQTHFMEVPFVYVLDLVRLRCVTLNSGLALTPVSKLRDVIVILFEALLKQGLLQATETYSRLQRDTRMMSLFHKLQSMMYGHLLTINPDVAGIQRVLNHDEVDNYVQFFPPCMSHLHKILRERHRLKHHSRIQYTLFLKEAGMTVHEALVFWKREYSSVPGGKKTCCHNWAQDEKRYTYNIRHLYGLEGSRFNYRGHSCKSLQVSDFGHTEEGGCPFARHDNSHLTALLQSEDLPSDNVKIILENALKGDYQKACQHLLLCKSESLQAKDYIKSNDKIEPPIGPKTDIDWLLQVEKFHSPIDFYCLLKDVIDYDSKV